MEKFLLLMTFVTLSAGIACSQVQLIAGWTFPGNSLAADTGLTANLTQEITSFGGTSAIELKNGFTTKAAQASGWNDGMEQKGWMIALSSGGFTNLSVSSRQQSGGTEPGPKYFRLQYSTDGGTIWTDLEGGDITVENDWETSFVDQLSLPDVCDDLDLLMVRWLMASNEASGNGGNVLEGGKSKIDEIFIRGEMINSVSEQPFQELTLLPGISSGSLKVSSDRFIDRILIHSLAGREIGIIEVNGNDADIDLSGFKYGHIVLITAIFTNNPATITRKYFLP